MKITLSDIQTALGEFRREHINLECKVNTLERENRELCIELDKARADSATSWWEDCPKPAPTSGHHCRRCCGPVEVRGDGHLCLTPKCPDHLWYTKWYLPNV